MRQRNFTQRHNSLSAHHFVSPSRPGGSGTSPPGRTSPEKADKAAEGGGAAGADQGSPGASGSAAGAGAGGRRERTEVDKLLDSDSDDEEGQGQGRGAQGRPGGSPGRPLSDLDAELQARAQAAAQVGAGPHGLRVIVQQERIRHDCSVRVRALTVNPLCNWYPGQPVPPWMPVTLFAV